MKRFFISIVMLLVAAATVFSATGDDVVGTPAKTEVSLAITADSGVKLIELVLTEQEIDADDLKATSTKPAAASSVSLTFGDTPNVAEGSLNAWWRVLYGAALDIQVGISSPMSNGTDSIKWSASWGESESKKTVDSPATSQENGGTYDTVGKHTPSADSAMTIGYAPISISTDADANYSNLGIGTYKSNLYLRCVTV